MDAFQVSQAVRRAIQYTVATRVTALLERGVPDSSERAAVAGGAAVLTVALRDETGGLPSTRVAADLALIVATNTLVRAVLADGEDSLPLTLAHLCCIIEVGSALSTFALGDLADSFVGQVQYTFANAVSALLLTSSSAVVAVAAAGGLTGLASWGASSDNALSVAFSQAAFNVAKTLMLKSIPAGLQLPTIAGLLAFVKPLHGKLGGIGQSLYSFAVYQAGDSIQSAVETQLAPSVAAAAAVAAAFVIPVESIQSAAKIAAVGSVTDWVVSTVQQAADQDPIPALLALLVFCRVVLVAFEKTRD